MNPEAHSRRHPFSRVNRLGGAVVDRLTPSKPNKYRRGRLARRARVGAVALAASFGSAGIASFALTSRENQLQSGENLKASLLEQQMRGKATCLNETVLLYTGDKFKSTPSAIDSAQPWHTAFNILSIGRHLPLFSSVAWRTRGNSTTITRPLELHKPIEVTVPVGNSLVNLLEFAIVPGRSPDNVSSNFSKNMSKTRISNAINFVNLSALEQQNAQHPVYESHKLPGSDTLGCGMSSSTVSIYTTPDLQQAAYAQYP